MAYFMAITEKISAEWLARLFKDNMWKLYRLLESMISNSGLQFAVELTKKLNKILGIKTKLSMLFHPQTDGQTEYISRIRIMSLILCRLQTK